MPTPPVPTFSINGHTYVDADFEQENMPATMSQLANDIATASAGAIIAGGYLSKAITGDTTLSSGEADNRVFNFSCTLGAPATVTFPAGFVGLALILNTNISGAQSIVITQGGSTVTVESQTVALVYGDGTNFAAAIGIVQTTTGSKVNGTLSITGNTTIDGTASVTGAVSVGGALTGTSATFSGDVIVGGGFDVEGTAAFQGDVNILGDVLAEGGFTADQLFAANGATITATSVSTALEVASTTNQSVIEISAPAGQASWVRFATTGFGVWLAGKNSEAQSGGNVGANFDIEALDDAGNPLGVVLRCRRSDLAFLLMNAPTSDPGESRVVWIDSNGFVRAAQ